MLTTYHTHISERSSVGLPPLPLNAEQVASLVELLKVTPASSSDAAELVDLLENRIPAGVDQAAYVKAAFLADVAKGVAQSALVSPHHAVKLLGTMLGGYNVQALVALLDSTDAALAAEAGRILSHTILMFDAYHDVAAKMKLFSFYSFQ